MTLLLPKLNTLSTTLPIDGAVRIELEEGVPIFRTSQRIQNRIEELLEKQKITNFSADEEHELNFYEEINDYLIFVNRTIRNLFLRENQ